MSRAEIVVQRARPGTALVSLIGEHDAFTAPKLSGELAALLAEELDVIVDLRRATFVDSRTVGVLLDALGAARERGKRLVLWVDNDTGPAVRKLVDLTRLGVVIPVVRSLEEAASRDDS
jgi:anti-anti-sigma factor